MLFFLSIFTLPLVPKVPPNELLKFPCEIYTMYVCSLKIRFVKMVSPAYTVVFTFSNADNTF